MFFFTWTENLQFSMCSVDFIEMHFKIHSDNQITFLYEYIFMSYFNIMAVF